MLRCQRSFLWFFFCLLLLLFFLLIFLLRFHINAIRKLRTDDWSGFVDCINEQECWGNKFANLPFFVSFHFFFSILFFLTDYWFYFMKNCRKRFKININNNSNEKKSIKLMSQMAKMLKKKFHFTITECL